MALCCLAVWVQAAGPAAAIHSACLIEIPSVLYTLYFLGMIVLMAQNNQGLKSREAPASCHGASLSLPLWLFSSLPVCFLPVAQDSEGADFVLGVSSPEPALRKDVSPQARSSRHLLGLLGSVTAPGGLK